VFEPHVVGQKPKERGQNSGSNSRVDEPMSVELPVHEDRTTPETSAAALDRDLMVIFESNCFFLDGVLVGG